ncbi:MAG: hypothetical protein EU536_01575 [Promethearchaeota archaeon]|nr:MAG: hypothetical protein EU536_01575 [Candidatus Lokiarchaeota archaeon]
MKKLQLVATPVLIARLEALHDWFEIVKPVCFRCRRQLYWNQKRFWDGQDEKQVYFFCDCGYENALIYLRFKWETEQDLILRNIKLR